jgi:hypothetical protein
MRLLLRVVLQTRQPVAQVANSVSQYVHALLVLSSSVLFLFSSFFLLSLEPPQGENVINN